MSATTEHPSPTILKRLNPFGEMPPPQLQTLSRQLHVHESPKGSTLLTLGSNDEQLLYLLEGDCKLIAADGGTKTIQHTDASAASPLARLRPSQYRVDAASTVRFLLVDPAMVNGGSSGELSSSLSLDAYEVEEQDELGHTAAENLLTLQIYEDLNADRLLLPSLPHVAVRIGEALNDDSIDAHKIARLIETDPAIAIKVVKAANSARFGGTADLTTVSDAVARLGMQNTHTLVVAFTLRELFRSSSKSLEKRMMALWEHSRRIAALAQVLAKRVGGFNNHEALLAGLVHDIGALAVISYARNFPTVADDPAALEASIHSLRRQLSGLILGKWKLPRAMINAAKEAEHWMRQHDSEADYADLVIVAQIHDGVAGNIDVDKVPAIGRLGLSADEIGQDVELLHNAHEEVAAAKRLLAR